LRQVDATPHDARSEIRLQNFGTFKPLLNLTNLMNSPDTLIRALLSHTDFDEWLSSQANAHRRLKNDLLVKYYLDDKGVLTVVTDGVVHMLEHDGVGTPYMGSFCCAVPDNILATICLWRALSPP
jgi:hypothetical protein